MTKINAPEQSGESETSIQDAIAKAVAEALGEYSVDHRLSVTVVLIGEPVFDGKKYIVKVRVEIADMDEEIDYNESVDEFKNRIEEAEHMHAAFTHANHSHHDHHLHTDELDLERSDSMSERLESDLNDRGYEFNSEDGLFIHFYGEKSGLNVMNNMIMDYEKTHRIIHDNDSPSLDLGGGSNGHEKTE